MRSPSVVASCSIANRTRAFCSSLSDSRIAKASAYTTCAFAAVATRCGSSGSISISIGSLAATIVAWIPLASDYGGRMRRCTLIGIGCGFPVRMRQAPFSSVRSVLLNKPRGAFLRHGWRSGRRISAWPRRRTTARSWFRASAARWTYGHLLALDVKNQRQRECQAKQKRASHDDFPSGTRAHW